ncbi:MAG: beta-ketoacyl synthase N-terminal-like domain-containing protein [Pseudomonadota bacterium]
MGNPLPVIAGALRCRLGEQPQAVAADLSRAEPQPLTLPEFPGRPFLYYPLPPASAGEGGALLPRLTDCAAEALQAAALSAEQRAGCGLFLGSSSFAIGDAEQEYRQALDAEPHALPLPHQRYGDLARSLCQTLDLGGGDYTFSTACTSSANALLYAHQAVSSGQMPVALVVGVEGFNRTSLLGFDSLQLLSDTGCRPLDAARDGMVLGEGIAALVITDAQPPATAAWHGLSLLGGANGCDPEGITGSSAEAMCSVMQQALTATATAAGDIALIKAHATGSLGNDAAETAAMARLFAQHKPPVTALKGALGHTLGACGVLELLSLGAALGAGTIPPCAGHQRNPDDNPLPPLRRAEPFPGGRVLCNYFGFGGNNTSLVLEVAGQ